jgi:hypothetical protein
LVSVVVQLIAGLDVASCSVSESGVGNARRGVLSGSGFEDLGELGAAQVEEVERLDEGPPVGVFEGVESRLLVVGKGF